MVFMNALVNNFWGYDTGIFTAAIINLVFVLVLRNRMDKFSHELYGHNDKSLQGKNTQILVTVNYEDAKRIKNIQHKVNFWYSLFANFITIFPLLGLIGTVYALINISGGEGVGNIQENFMISLTSTFWGMVFAIIYKVVDSFHSPNVDLYNSDAIRTIKRQED